MRLPKIFQLFSIVTVLALIYIHMQMQIFDLAYQGKSREQKIVELTEGNRMISYNISRLKSANYLGGSLLAEDSDLRFRDNKSIVQLVTTRAVEEKEEVRTSQQQQINPILKFLSLRSQAEARAIERKKSVEPWQRKDF